MRHLKAGRGLSRNSAHRKALLRNLVTALIQRERIRTTLAKAKELRSKAEKTITLGKKGTLHARRRALGYLNEKAAVVKIFGPLAERYAARKGGYTRIIKVGNRKGDDAPMAIIELVDRPEDAKPAPKQKGEAKGAAKADKAGDKKPAKKAEAKEKKAPAKEGGAKKAAPKKKAEDKEKK